MAYQRNKKVFKKKVCRFCANKDIVLDYKNVEVLNKFVAESGKIEPSRLTGTSANHQTKMHPQIKKARQMTI